VFYFLFGLNSEGSVAVRLYREGYAATLVCSADVDSDTHAHPRPAASLTNQLTMSRVIAA
jgi:hypothetical protein